MVKENYENSTFRQSVYGSQEITQWEACGSANCYPGIFPPQGETCSLGRLSSTLRGRRDAFRYCFHA